jgi:restriction system protein
MDGIEFEILVGRVLRSSGYEVGGTPATGDQGADLIATKHGKTIAIQVKRYAAPVGNSAVQEIVAALRFYKVDEGWVITNNTFTASAEELAKANGVRLVDGMELRRMLGEAQNSRSISQSPPLLS